MTADRCDSRIAHETGVVLRCMLTVGHDGLHETPVESWPEGDDRTITGSAAEPPPSARSPLSVDLGARLRDARRRRGLTQQDVADIAGLTRSSIANVEAGRQEIPVRTLVAIAAGIGEPVAALLGEAPPTVLPQTRVVATYTVVCADCGPVGAADDGEDARKVRVEHLRREHLLCEEVTR